ncbi:hypothetical protein QUB60_08780 [Microcoleus sp. A2-C5]|uniref:hypothetical protein n=1 Tax=Microcoleus sp. A2-C2 TaxID=2818530 RepID=UPI002FD466BC
MSAGTSPATAAFTINSWTPVPITHQAIPSNAPCPLPKNIDRANREEQTTVKMRAEMPMRSNKRPKTKAAAGSTAVAQA